MSENQKDLIRLCGLWKSETSEGKAYYYGSLSYSTNLLLFTNDYKESPDDKKPDLILYIGKREKKEQKPQQPKDTTNEVPF
ncbi:hypothetical protein ES703_39281 [subsurface metagenome]